MIPALTILHVAIAAAWFGHKLLVPGDVRASTRLDQAGPFVARLQRAERFGIATGVGTALSGAALWWAVGFDTVDLGVWIGAGLVVGAMVVGATLGRPASKRLIAAIQHGDRVEATVAGNRVNQVLGLESLLWIGALAAMVL